jgi:hypothetical protein
MTGTERLEARVRGWWRVSHGVLAAVVLASVVALPASATEHTGAGIAAVCPPPPDATIAVPPSFPDRGVVHGAAIACAGAYGLVAGFPDGTFRPAVPVTRGQMATFVAGWLRAATGLALPTSDEVGFSDLEGSTHERAIRALATAGIIGGRVDGTFGPGEPLTRGQFARAMVNAISYADVFAVGGPLPPAADPAIFTDVVGTTFAAEIGALAGAGITRGNPDGTFLPNAQVTRGQLATFLMQGASYLDRHQRWRPTAVTVVQFASLSWRDVPPTAASGTEPGGQTGATGTAVLSVNAFNGTLAFTLDLSNVQGPYTGASGATLHLGGPGVIGPRVLTLAEATTLSAAAGGVVTGVVEEADSAIRFADLVRGAEQVYVVIATRDHPEGAVRGQLQRLAS